MSQRLPGQIKVEPGDFMVWEVPGVSPEGAGDHLYLWVEKTALSTPHLLAELARRSGLRTRDLGVAGRKDKWAITQQWVSLPMQLGANEAGLPGDGEAVAVAEGEFRILKRSRHTRSLKTGQLRGNRFGITLRGLDEAQRAELLARATRLGEAGRMLNPFGAQRFIDPGALEQAKRVLDSGRMRGRKDNFLLSIAQAAVFNRYLLRRGDELLVEGEWYGTHQQGRFDGSREDPARLLERLQAGEIQPLGPLPGRDIRPSGRCAELLDEALCDLDLQAVDWSAFGKRLRGTWRPLWVPLCDLTAEAAGDGPRLSFTLPAGSYATVLLERLLEGRWIIPSS